MRNAVVTGGAGFIGHHLVKKLLNKNYKVQIIDNLSNCNKDFVHELSLSRDIYDNILIYNEDIRNKAALSHIFKEGIDTCIHLAAKTSVPDSVVNPYETMDVNVRGTLNILEMCSKYGVQNFVFASSAAVYGRSQKLPLTEDMILEPVSPYGASKVAGEALISAYRSKLKNCLSLRFFNVYGEGQSSDYAGVITKFIENLSNQLPPIIHGDGHQTRDFISVNDVADAIIAGAENNSLADILTRGHNIFNIGRGRPTSMLELASLMIDIFELGTTTKPIYSDPIPGDIRYSYGSIERARDLLQFNASEDLKLGLKKLIEGSHLQKKMH